MSKQIIYEISANNKILDHNSDPSFSKNVDYPNFTLGFQHFIHQSELKMDITKQFEGKKKIYLVMSEYETTIDEHEDTIQNMSNKYFNIKNPITGRTFYKLWEIFFLFDIIDLSDSNYVTVLLDEPNVNLLRAVMLYRDKFSKNKNKGTKYVGSIINTDYVEKIKKNKKSVAEYNIDNSIGKSKANLIITNGFKSELSPVLREQESYKMILNQIIYVLENQADGGTFICKIYESFTNIMSKIISILTGSYDKVYIVKPLMSRHINSEKYIICSGFKKGSSKHVDKLISIVNHIDKNKNGNLVDIFPDYILDPKFKSSLIAANTQIANQQFININDVVSFINKQNYRGYEYDTKRQAQIDASAYWVETFMPDEKGYSAQKKNIDEMLKEIVKNGNTNVSELMLKLNK